MHRYYFRQTMKINLQKAIIALVFSFCGYAIVAQTHSIILGRPTDTSITASVMFDQKIQFYLEYGTQTGIYTQTTSTYTTVINTPDEVELTALIPNTKYYYRLRYRMVGTSSFLVTPEYTFHTQRAVGSTFTFTIESDEHLYDKKGVKNMYDITLANQAADKPDFMISLGDIFGDDHEPFTVTSEELDLLHRDYRPFLGKICHSIPFYVCLGNHEGENDYYYSLSPPDNLCVWATKWRKFYYPNPYPNSFYTGNTINEPYNIGNPENYYAWTWGNALFVVLDVYRDQCDTSAKPGGWSWTLGFPQYTWLKNTLEKSTAQYKFVFAHHIRGQGRGGITNAKLYEWGGYDGQGATIYNFSNKRPGWAKPIHQLFIDNGVNIFFQGHDHVFAHELLDGVTYQAVPMAADSTYEIGKLANADAYTSDTFGGAGHIRVLVSPSCVKVDFVRAYLPADTITGVRLNGEVAFTYTIGNCSTTGATETIQKEFVTIFPNPVKDNLILNFSNENMSHHIKMVDACGRIIMQTKSNVIDVSMIPNGVYFLYVYSEKNQIVKKLCISH